MKNLFKSIQIYSNLFLLIGVISCSIDSPIENLTEEVENIGQENIDYLVFEDIHLFESSFINLEDDEDNNFYSELNKYAMVPDNFISLKNKISKEEIGFDVDNVHNFRTTSIDDFLNINPDSISELIPDTKLRNFLNEKLEIQIAGKFYKITPFGTFFTKKDNIENLKDFINNLYTDENPNLKLPELDRIEVFEVKRDIFLFPTFHDESENIQYENVSRLNSTSNASVNGDKVYQYTDYGPIPLPYPYLLSLADYENFAVHKYGANTVVGKFFEGIGTGTNNSYKQYWTSLFRLKVKLYSFDYVFYKSIGLNAKMQKKGWTGFWAKQNNVKANKLVVGWDTMIFTIKHQYSLPLNYQTLPFKGAAKEILNFTNFNVAVGSVTDLRVPFLNLSPSNYNSLEKALKKITEKKLTDLTKDIWKEAEETFATSSYQIKNERYKAYRKVFPDETKVVIGRWEVSQNNSNEISLVIDRSFGVTWSWTSGVDPNFFNQVLTPTVTKNKIAYKIDAASVFGAANFLNETKGIRIIKELN
jgi:hypothetical protein